jgi:cellulose synthase/poly-beta-1,6-N-acetylglucosamine synthase-like glycosyltransferase
MELLDRLADPSQQSAQDLSVIVCTRDRPHALARCLASLAAQDAPPGQIIVVDNSAGRTAEAPEPAAGVSREWAMEGKAGVTAAPRAMVVSGHPLASEVGRDVLRAGGNAVDAAVAVGFALAVLHPAPCCVLCPVCGRKVASARLTAHVAGHNRSLPGRNPF